MKQTVLICGSGNGAHVLVGLTSSNKNIQTRVLVLNGNRADLWNKALKERPLTCIFTNHAGKDTEIQSQPDVISAVPSEVVPQADIILISVPAFSHERYLKAIEPYIKVPTLIIGFPGQPGFEFQLHSLLKDKLDLTTVMSAETLPWACRIMEYGNKIEIKGVKKSVKVAIICDNIKKISKINPLETLKSLIWPKPKFTSAQHFQELSLSSSQVHPGLMYAKWKEWDGNPLHEKAAFYHGADDDQARCIDDMDAEIIVVAKEISRQKPHIDLKGCLSTYQWLVTAYGSAVEKSSLKTALLSNKAYQGLFHPMIDVDGGFVPDFSHRYLTEDIPFGLVVTKGLAQLAGVDTPLIDSILNWAQRKLCKEFLVGSELKGENVSETRAPQAYGITSLDDLDTFLENLSANEL